MNALSAEKIVTAWETGAGRGPLDRALVLLWAAEMGDAADLPLAERDLRLLALRRATFGAVLEAVADCPGCGARVELALDAATLAGLLTAPGVERIPVPGADVTLRPLTSRDLAAAAGHDEDGIARVLRRRLSDHGDGLPEAALELIDAAIEAREAAGEIRIALQCADCGTGWHEPLDIAAHVWAEVAGAALKILGEVAEIASAFGWAEADIMAMAAPRRAAYLQLARGG